MTLFEARLTGPALQEHSMAITTPNYHGQTTPVISCNSFGIKWKYFAFCFIPARNSSWCLCLFHSLMSFYRPIIAAGKFFCLSGQLCSVVRSVTMQRSHGKDDPRFYGPYPTNPIPFLCLRSGQLPAIPRFHIQFLLSLYHRIIYILFLILHNVHC